MIDREQAIRAVLALYVWSFSGRDAERIVDAILALPDPEVMGLRGWSEEAKAELDRSRPVAEAARKMDGARFDEDCGKPDCVECVAFRALNAALAAYDAGEPVKPVVADEKLEGMADAYGFHGAERSAYIERMRAALDGER